MGNSSSNSKNPILDNILNDNIFTKKNIAENKDIYYISDDKYENVVSALENHYNKIKQCNKSMLSQDFKSVISNELDKYNKNKQLDDTQINNIKQSLFRRLNSECSLRYGGNIQGGSNRVGGKKSKKNKKSKKSKSKKNKKSKSKKNKKSKKSKK